MSAKDDELEEVKRELASALIEIEHLKSQLAMSSSQVVIGNEEDIVGPVDWTSDTSPPLHDAQDSRLAVNEVVSGYVHLSQDPDQTVRDALMALVRRSKPLMDTVG